MPKINLKKIATTPPSGLDKGATKKETKQLLKRLRELQRLLWANQNRSLLVVFQGMDASGKGGAVRNVFSAVNPMGVDVAAFKKPSKKELSHDFLWRIHQNAPAKGMIQIFDRSHYEDVLVTRVMGWVSDEKAHKRFKHINAFEDLLQDSGTAILKFYLHVSEAEQRQRFYERLSMPHKHWKYSPADLDNAKYWEAFRKVYEDVFEHCGPAIPWHIVPTDKNWYKEYYITKTIVDTLESFNMQYPKGEVDMNDPRVKGLLKQIEADKEQSEN